MRDLATALISYTWAQSLFTAQQVLRLTLAPFGKSNISSLSAPATEAGSTGNSSAYSASPTQVVQTAGGLDQQAGWGPMP